MAVQLGTFRDPQHGRMFTLLHINDPDAPLVLNVSDSTGRRNGSVQFTPEAAEWLRRQFASSLSHHLRPKRECRVCGRLWTLRGDGMLRKHRHSSGGICPGSDGLPVEEAA